MPGHIIQSFLHDAIYMNGGAAIDWKGLARFFIEYANPSLPFHDRQIPVQRALQSSFFEHHGMQSLRKAAYFVERALHNLAYFAQFGPQLRSLGSMLSGARKHG